MALAVWDHISGDDGVSIQPILLEWTWLVKRIELIEPYISGPDVADKESTVMTITA